MLGFEPRFDLKKAHGMVRAFWGFGALTPLEARFVEVDERKKSTCYDGNAFEQCTDRKCVKDARTVQPGFWQYQITIFY